MSDSYEFFIPWDTANIQDVLLAVEQQRYSELRVERAHEVSDSIRAEMSSRTWQDRLGATSRMIHVDLDHESMPTVVGKCTWVDARSCLVVSDDQESLIMSEHVVIVRDLGRKICPDATPLGQLIDLGHLWLGDLIDSQHRARWFIHSRGVVNARCVAYGENYAELVAENGILTVPIKALCAIQIA